jgi:hypothetical protein
MWLPKWIKARVDRIKAFHHEANDPVLSEQRRIRDANETIERLDEMRAGHVRRRDEAQARLDAQR